MLVSNAIQGQEKGLIHLSEILKNFYYKRVPVDAYKSSLINKDEKWIYWIDNSKFLKTIMTI